MLCVCSVFAYGNFDRQQLEVVMRSIGNKVLWSQGDSTSRVLPIKVIADENLFSISFESSRYITSDSLYDIVSKELSKVGITSFVAELKNCQNNEVVLAFINYEANDSLQPCRGRETPFGCYQIDITIKNDKTYLKTYFGLIFVIGVGLILYYFNKKNNATLDIDEEYVEENITSHLKVGHFTFLVSELKLVHEEEVINLTDKESKLLSMFIDAKNQVLSREKLMSDIWGESGVMVISRNIDVLVSKLRKKLSSDPSIKIINVHGVGYRMEV